ncbi:glycosyltransferase family 2 protein [Spirosoma fluviale]|uniref:Glycosyltransferase, GT2 family n=1 Tax=Spirosoma fluviale TaxID=1597977 RepID=A0A286FIE1_9BACT|nr:glycosyltransferase family 2 protein [Spirosoma fluviale]SOD82983.1 Glycosyltransferase, GT2 family [Spirosoma fluviale]
MKQSFVYQIKHIQLAESINLPAVPTNETGWYLVFWWRQVPVGHLFVEPGEVVTPAELAEKCWLAIQPTLQVYCTASNLPDLAGLSATAPPTDLQEVLSTTLSTFDVETLPNEVPISVVICTRNRAPDLKIALQALKDLPCKPAEIVVVDNAPTDNSTAQVVAQFPDVIYCHEPRPGLDIARNSGIRMATMPVMAYVDDDVQVHAHWAYHIWKTFQDTNIAAMTGLVIAAELDTEAQLIFEKHWSFNRGYVDKQYDATYFNRTLFGGPPVWEIGAGANMAFRRDLFEKIGYFDERLDVGAAGCNGDSEMWFRVLTNNYAVHYNPRAVVFHKHRQQLPALKKQLFSYMRGHTAAALIQQKYHPQAGYRRHVFKSLPLYYLHYIKDGFPAYAFRHQTIGMEIRGALSGVLFYLKNRNRPSQPQV